MKISNVIKTKTKGYVWIDTCQLTNKFGNLMDSMGFGNQDAKAFEYETMVFPCKKNGDVKDWGDLDHENYPSEKKAEIGHKTMIKKWRNK